MTFENLIYSMVGAVVGLVIGLSTRVRWIGDRLDGGEKIELTFPQRAFYLVIGILAVVSVAITAVSANNDQQAANEQRAAAEAQAVCNQDLIRVLNVNRDLAAQDRDNLRGLLGGVGRLVLGTAEPMTTEQRQVAFQDLFRTYLSTEQRNEQARQPYPPPDCGE